jgi:F0F1-type ATP synthase assembly protein I
MYLFIKIISSAAIIGAVTELARRFPIYGGIIAALPLISILSIIWLTVQGEPAKSISQFTLGVLTGFPATAVMLLVIYMGIKHSLHLTIAILLGIVSWGLFLIIQKFIMEGFVL